MRRLSAWIIPFLICPAIQFSSLTRCDAANVSQAAEAAGLPSGPEKAIKAFMFALYSSNEAEYQKWIVPEPHSNDLLSRKQLSDAELKTLRSEVESMHLRQASPFTVDGHEIRPKYPISTRTSYTGQFRGWLLVIPVVQTTTGWKVDIRFWLATRREAEHELRSSEPEVIARQFLFYLLARKPEKLAGLSATRINGEDYTAANDLPSGDLDQVLSLCLEMPVVRAKAGEAFRLPSGRVVRGGNEPDSMVLVGMLGMIEVAFQLKRVGTEWKVVPEHYFEMLRHAGAI